MNQKEIMSIVINSMQIVDRVYIDIYESKSLIVFKDHFSDLFLACIIPIGGENCLISDTMNNIESCFDWLNNNK